MSPRLPVPHFNVVNGGAHAPNNLDFQEFMLAPLGAPTIAEAVRAGAEVYAALKRRLTDAGYATGLGDEGGFAPDISRPEDVLATLVGAITDAGYTAGRDGVAIALDPAASEFYRDGAYHVGGQAAQHRRHGRATTASWSTGSRSGASRTASPRATGTAGQH